MASEYFKEYICSYTTGNTYASVVVRSTYQSLEYFSALPTQRDLEALFGEADLLYEMSNAFEDCVNMKAAPRLPDDIYDINIYNGLVDVFRGCSSLIIPPMLPKNARMTSAFRDCISMTQAPVIPISDTDKGSNYMFSGCSALLAPCSIPASDKAITQIYNGCASMAGEMIVRSTPTSYSNALQDTVKPITIYGDQAVCEAIAATANNGNASWSPWYDPVPAVTDRGQGSYTTAADMTRMVRNGALAVSSYAPGRMVYQTGDIVREDEWIALVDAAKTIDPSVTYSTIYSNLNKIEAAFDSAL